MIRTAFLFATIGLVLLGCGASSSELRNIGLFSGKQDVNTVTLLLQDGQYFLMSGNFVSKGTYTVKELQFDGAGQTYDLANNGQVSGSVSLSGIYKTNKHLQLNWRQPDANGVDQPVSAILEGSDIFYDDSPISKVVGGIWVNQNQGDSNITALSISNNHDPFANDDLVATNVGEAVNVDVLANDFDSDADVLKIVPDDNNTPPQHGMVAIDDKGTPDDFSDDDIRYTPDAGFTGTDTFGYSITDRKVSAFSNKETLISATVRVTVPAGSVNVGLTMLSGDPAPAVGDNTIFTLTLNNPSTTSVAIQVKDKLPSGFSYVSDTGAGSYNPDSGLWSVDSLPGTTRQILSITARVNAIGAYRNAATITGLSARDPDPADNTASVTLQPVDLGGGTANPAAVAVDEAHVAGFILTSLTQISGTIATAKNGDNAYSLSLTFSGTTGGAGVLYKGFSVVTQEGVNKKDAQGNDVLDDQGHVVQELRPVMLILTANDQAVYLNKLFWTSTDEWQNAQN